MALKFGGVSGRLTPGVHSLSWADAEKLLAYNSERRRLMGGLLNACYNFRAAGISQLYLDGSFVTKKAVPSDWDACYSTQGVDPQVLDPVFRDFDNDRAAQKAKYLGEAFPADAQATLHGEPFLSFFQKTKDGKAKGIVVIDLGTLP